jgi:hypothetical protein
VRRLEAHQQRAVQRRVGMVLKHGARQSFERHADREDALVTLILLTLVRPRPRGTRNHTHKKERKARRHRDPSFSPRARLFFFLSSLFDVLQLLVVSAADYLCQPWPLGPAWRCQLPYAVAVVQYKAVAVPLWGCLAYACR